MSQIEELQSRLTAALERIDAGLDGLAAAPAEAGEPDPGLAVALEEEKLANAQLEERLRVIKSKHQEEIDALTSAHAEALAAVTTAHEEEMASAKSAHEAAAAALKADHAAQVEALSAKVADSAELDRLQAELASQNEALARLDMDVQRLRQSNDQLRDSNEALRKANEEGVGDPHLINKAMLAELESLRAARATDTAEAGAVLARLEPLLARAADMPEGEEA